MKTIIAKPKTSTNRSLYAFIGIAFCVFLYGLGKIYVGSQPIIIYMFIIGISGLLWILVGVRFVMNYKIIEITGGKTGKILVRYPAFRKKFNYELGNLKSWEEFEIKTYNAVYKQLELVFDDMRKVAISKQEQEQYDDVLSFMERNAKGQRVKSEK